MAVAHALLHVTKCTSHANRAHSSPLLPFCCWTSANLPHSYSEYGCTVMLPRVGMELATVQVRVENLKVAADIAVGSRGNPTVTNTLRNMAEVIKALLHLTWVLNSQQLSCCNSCMAALHTTHVCIYCSTAHACHQPVHCCNSTSRCTCMSRTCLHLLDSFELEVIRVVAFAGSAAQGRLDQGLVTAIHYPGHNEHNSASWQIHTAARPAWCRQINPAERSFRSPAQEGQR